MWRKQEFDLEFTEESEKSRVESTYPKPPPSILQSPLSPVLRYPSGRLSSNTLSKL